MLILPRARALSLLSPFALPKLRRYSPETERQEQPLTSFHFDSAALTVNVALTDDGVLDGGSLLGVYGGKVHRIRRGEGEATVHSSSLLHGVSMLRRGVRYSLICFFTIT